MTGRGFTLIELLVAIAIFSIIGLGANQMLRTVIDSDERVQAAAREFTDVGLALAFIERDVSQFVDRPIRDGFGDPLEALMLGGEYALELTRTGWQNPGGLPRSKAQRVAYQVDYDTKELRRYFWTVLDRAEDSEPIERLVLTGVTDFRVTGIESEESDVDTVDDITDEGDELGEEQASAYPAALEIAVATETLGEVVRLFQMPATPMRGLGGGSPQPPNEPDR